MGLFSRAKASQAEADTPSPTQMSFQEHAGNFTIRTIRTLFLFLKDAAFDIEEIESAKFKTDLDTLSEAYVSESKIRNVEGLFKSQRVGIANYLERQKRYILEKELELRDIIELLSKAMTNQNVENREIYRRVQDHGEKIEQITLLDDIKRIKQNLKEEVEQMRSFMQEKEANELEQIELLSNQVSILQKELEQAKTKSLMDGLTGTFNRQAFDDFIREDVARCLIMNQPLSLILLDIDDFKVINDTYGHLIGDRVLMAFANKCNEFIRSDDLLARYGGEEFVIVLKGATLRNAVKKAKLICKSIAATRYSVDEDPGGRALQMTVSVGVSAIKDDDTHEALIQRADQALYAAKRAGKNRVISENKIR